jgi:hypothetical protein
MNTKVVASVKALSLVVRSSPGATLRSVAGPIAWRMKARRRRRGVRRRVEKLERGSSVYVD